MKKNSLPLVISLCSLVVIVAGSVNPALATSIAESMKGKILLQVESHGEAWYIEPTTLRRFYLKDGAAAYQGLRKFGMGIRNVDLNKIPVGIEKRIIDTDTDGDGLPDKLEEGLKTNPALGDTDGDGVSDGDEVLINKTNPLGPGRLVIDGNLVNKLRGKIVLQVESRGEAWYINPTDGKRYYMKDGDASYAIMRFLSQGISNANLGRITLSPESTDPSLATVNEPIVVQPQQNITTVEPQLPASTPVESWSELEAKYFITASQNGWTALTITNGLGEKRYYRKEGAYWVQKNSLAEAQLAYVEPPTSIELANLRLFCAGDATISSICQSSDFISGYNNTLSFRKAINDLVTQGLAIITESQRQKVAQQEQVYQCILEPTPLDQLMLSPQQQKYLREQQCGTATPSSELNFKLYQQQEYQECLINNLSSSLPITCEYLKPIFY